MFFLHLRPSSVVATCRLAGITAVALALVTAHAQAQTALTLDEALRLAQQRSRQLPAQDAAAAAARDMSVAAGQRPDPVIKGGLINVPVTGPERFSLTKDFMTMRSIGVMQEFTREDKRQARAARFEREADLAQAGWLTALAELQRDTAMAWLELHYRLRMDDMTQGLRREAELQIEAADAAYRGGRGSQADVFAARSAVATIDDRLRQMAREIATARVRLARWVGDSAAQGLGATPDMTLPPLDLAVLESTLENHPRIAWLARKEGLARAEVDAAKSEKSSDWSAELMYSQRGPEFSNMVSVSVSIPLQWNAGNRQDRELAAKLALAQRERDEREEALREVTALTRSAILTWRSERERLAHYDTRLLPLAAERVHAALAAYRGASGPLSAVLEARRMEIDTRLERLRIEMDAAGLWAQL
ncbi:MAG: TolC family protein, partial [Rubrivivax sp.]